MIENRAAQVNSLFLSFFERFWAKMPQNRCFHRIFHYNGFTHVTKRLKWEKQIQKKHEKNIAKIY